LSAQIQATKRFEDLLRPHFDALHAAAGRMTLSSSDAEDLVQDVCLKAFTRLDELEQIEYPRAWLLKMLYNKFIDHLRARQRSAVDLAETGSDSSEPDQLAPNHWQPEEMLDREIRITRILMAMKRLNPEQCALVALRDIEGLSIAELEDLTGAPGGTIKSQLHRTRAKLGRLLSSDTSLKPNLRAIGS
jgi:RNA polymerase sigma-70 factor (ECF subfamily)